MINFWEIEYFDILCDMKIDSSVCISNVTDASIKYFIDTYRAISVNTYRSITPIHIKRFL